jgi:hypothetical protein
MKLIKNLLFAGLALATIHVNAQTVDEVIAKHNAAMGGVEKIKTLTSIKRTGSMNMQGMDLPMVMTISHLKGMRVDMEIMGTSNYRILTPDKGYMFFPIQQMTEPKELEADEVQAAQGQLDLQGIFIDTKEKAAKIELVGSEKVDGNDAYKLKITRKSGKESFYFIDKKTNFVVKSTGKDKGPDGNEMDTETTFSDYKQNKDGYWFAYTITSARGPIVFETIESNVKIDENIFKN